MAKRNPTKKQQSLKGELAHKLLAANPKLPTRQLARMLYEENKELFLSLESARSLLRMLRGNNGAKNRREVKDRRHYRKPGKAGWSPSLPPSKAEPWKPHKMPGERILVLSDAHIPYHDEEAIQAAVAFAVERHTPDSVLINGDWADMFSVSRWEKDPKKRDLRAEVESVRQSLLWLRHETNFVPLVYKKGNHEERLDKYFWTKAPELWGLPQVQYDGLLKIDEDLEPVEELEDVVFIGDQRPIMANALPIMHGHELPKGLTNAVNPSRGAFLRTTDSMMTGHHHQSSSHTQYTWDKKPISCWSTGCLCDMNPEYARINKWNLGFAVIEKRRGRNYWVYNYKFIDNYEVVTA